jgi:hypothetical protein
MPDTLQHALCLYKRLDNGVHKFTFRASSPAAVNEWYEVMCAIAEITVDDEVVRVLIDNRLAEMLPMNSMLQRSRDLSGRFPERSKTRTVILYKPGSLASLAENFTRLSQTDQREKVRFFPGEVADEAMAWLLADDE